MERWLEVHQFWFGPLLSEAGPTQQAEVLAHKQNWFLPSSELDRTILEQFGDDIERAMRGEYKSWLEQPRSCLALILLFDQFPRNAYRGTPRAFRYDPYALLCASRLAPDGNHQLLHPLERVFVYLPFEHAECLRAQQLSVDLFTELLSQAPSDQKPEFQDYLLYARKHCEIVERFGRFPHRNQILGRPTTPEEEQFLRLPGSSF